MYSLAAQGDFPAIFAKINSRFHTPTVAILVYAGTGWLLAVSGTALFVLALAAGATTIYYAGMCAALPRLRKLRPKAPAFRVPFAPVLSILAVAVCLALLSALTVRQSLLMVVTALLGAANWLWMKRRPAKSSESVTPLLDNAS